MGLVLAAINYANREPAVVGVIVDSDGRLGIANGAGCLSVVEDPEIAMVMREQAERPSSYRQAGQLPGRLQHREEGGDARLDARMTERPIESLDGLAVSTALAFDDRGEQEGVVLVRLHGKDLRECLPRRVEVVAGERGLALGEQRLHVRRLSVCPPVRDGRDRREARQRLVAGRVVSAIGARRARVVAESVADEAMNPVQGRMEKALV